MNSNSQNNTVLTKEKKDRDMIRKLCKQLDVDYLSILGFDPGFNFFGSLQNKRYFIYADNELNSKSKYSIEFRFSIHYLKSLDVLKRDELKSNLTDQELDKIADERRVLTSIFIEYMGVRPQGDGIGTLLIRSFLKRVKHINKFKMIFLFPEDIRAEKFWRNLGFRDISPDDLKSKAFPNSYYAKMVYDLSDN
jgi:hypothetical protein